MLGQTIVYSFSIVHDPAFINILTAWSRGVLEKETVAKIAKKFPASYGTRRFITVFTRSRHWPLPCPSWIHSTPSLPISSKSFVPFTPRSWGFRL